MKRILYYLSLSLVVLSSLLISCSKSAKHADTREKGMEQTSPDKAAASEEIQTLKEALSNGKPTVVDFYATWCGPCRMIAPVFQQLREKYSERINFVSIDVDADPQIAARYQVEAMPTFLFLDNSGEEKDRLVGASEPDLVNAVESMLTWN